MDSAARILQHTVVAGSVLVPELKLHLITEDCALWHGPEQAAVDAGMADPFWAFCWPGGQALARHVLDHPQLVRGRRILDFGSGSAVEGLAALRAGAGSVLAADLDPLAGVAAKLNARLNDLPAPDVTTEDLVGSDVDFDLVLAGDVFYDPELAARGLSWLKTLANRGIEVLVGDPSRGFLDVSELELVATYRAGADGDTTGADLRDASVYRVSSTLV